MRRSLHSPRWIAFLAALAVAATACGAGADRGVAVQSVDTDLAFGVPDHSPGPATPAGMRPVTNPLPVVVAPDADRSAPQRDRIEPIPPPELCPQAGLTAAPERVAPSDVEGMPEEGRYRWVVQGQQEVDGIGIVSLDRMGQRTVRDVERTGSDTFRFTTVESEVAFGSTEVVHTTYEVVEDDGVYLVEIERRGEEGESTFEPQPPVLVFALPGQIGQPPLGVGVFIEQEQMDTVGIDPGSLESLRHTGTTTNRKHVDACGELIDTYYVEGWREFVSAFGETYQQRYRYSVATHMGGLILFEHVERPCPTVDEEESCQPTPDLSYEARIGQLEPDPLPAQEDDD